MANINKSKAVRQATGLPTKEDILTSPMNNDNLTASIKAPDGREAPAMLTEGEFVFSVPAIIALGEGDYDTGAQMLTGIHEQLRQVGNSMMGQQEQPQRGLAALQGME